MATARGVLQNKEDPFEQTVAAAALNNRVLETGQSNQTDIDGFIEGLECIEQDEVVGRVRIRTLEPNDII